MKEKAYSKVICKGFCNFYKEGKEEIHCGGYEILINNVTPKEIQLLSHHLSKQPIDESQKNLDDFLMEFVCKRCDFEIDGCDFREGNPSPPCGGYIIISKLLSYFSNLEDIHKT